MLVEGMGESDDQHGSWRGFSGAIVRQAVGEAVSSLPPRQRQLIKLAYFGDLSNREIAQGLGITLGSVERGLRQAIAQISEHVEHGRAAGRRAIYALAMFLGGRWLSEAHQATASSAQPWVKAGTLLLVTATVGALLTAQPASRAPRAHIEQATVPIVVSEPGGQVPAPQIRSLRNATGSFPRSAGVTAPTVPEINLAPPALARPALTLPVDLTLPPLAVRVTVPPLPVSVEVPPVVHGLLGA